MNQNKSKFLSAILLLSFLLTTPFAFAQSPEEPSTDDPAVPLDGGITILLAAGAAVGSARVYRNRTK